MANPQLDREEHMDVPAVATEFSVEFGAGGISSSIDAPGDSAQELRANARRIAAAWNAARTAGLSTPDLEEDRPLALARAVRLVLALHESGNDPSGPEAPEPVVRLDPMAERQLREALPGSDPTRRRTAESGLLDLLARLVSLTAERHHHDPVHAAARAAVEARIAPDVRKPEAIPISHPETYGGMHAQFSARLRAALESFGLRHLGSGFFQGGYSLGYRIWMIGDNGGELNVELVNHPEGMVSVAYAHGRRAANPFTVAMRIWDVVNGRPVDYARTWTEEDLDGILRGELGLS